MACANNNCLLSFKEAVILTTKRQDLVKYLVQHKVINGFTKCIKCGEVADLNINTLNYRCGKVRVVDRSQDRKKKLKVVCNFKKSALMGTWFQRSKMKIGNVFYFCAIWLMLPYPRQNFIIEELKCSSMTVVDWSSFCREVCINYGQRNSQKIGGHGKIVEIDEAKFGKRKYNRGRIITGQWVFGGIERGTNNTFLVPVEKRDAETLLSVVKEWILPGTTIISDFWKAYDCLANEGFQHLKVNHSINFVDPEKPEINTQKIERTWRDVRGNIPRYGRKESHFIGYLAEFQFKKKLIEMKDYMFFLLM